MKVQQNIQCMGCSVSLSKDEIGINKKLLENDTKKNRYRCIACLAEYLECDVDELIAKIEQFKAEGCRLFQ